MIDIRPERPGDEAGIGALIAEAFRGTEHSSGTEAAIVERLRAAGALTLSLVADDQGSIRGHAAFSPVRIDGEARGWFGLGPVAVVPDRQGEGIGASLVRRGLDELRGRGASGCVVLGEPAYYERFGFAAAAPLRFPGPPARYFQALSWTGTVPSGMVAYHAAFEA